MQPGPKGARASASSATSLPCWENDGVFTACCSSSKESVLPLSGAGGAIRRLVLVSEVLRARRLSLRSRLKIRSSGKGGA